MNSEAVSHLGVERIEYLFYWLNARQGGDGMGVASMNPFGKTRVHKGLDMGPNEAAHWVYNRMMKGDNYFVFHCRMATTGSVNSRNCHPFKHGDLVLAHNGVCSEFGGIDDRTDSEGVALTLQRTGLPTEFLDDVSGVFVGFRAGRPFVVKGQTYSNLELAVGDDGAFLFASSMPYEIQEQFDAHEHLQTYMWLGLTQAEVDDAEAAKKAKKVQRGGQRKTEWGDYDLLGYDWGKYYDGAYGVKATTKTRKRSRPRYKQHSPTLTARLNAETPKPVVSTPYAGTATLGTYSSTTYPNGVKTVTTTDSGGKVMTTITPAAQPHPVKIVDWKTRNERDIEKAAIREFQGKPRDILALALDIDHLSHETRSELRQEVYKQGVDDLCSVTNRDQYRCLLVYWKTTAMNLNNADANANMDKIQAYVTMLRFARDVVWTDSVEDDKDSEVTVD